MCAVYYVCTQGKVKRQVDICSLGASRCMCVLSINWAIIAMCWSSLFDGFLVSVYVGWS